MMSRIKLPGRFKMLGSMALVLMVFFSGGAFADELVNASAVTPDIMDKFTNLGLAMLVAHMWSKDADRKEVFITKLFERHEDEKKQLIDLVKSKLD